MGITSSEPGSLCDVSRDALYLRMFLDHRAALIDYAAPIVGGRSQAEDVVQEAYIRFAQQAETGRARRGPILEPIGYLYRIVRNLAVDMVRRGRFELASEAGRMALAATVAATPDPEETARFREEVRAVAAALDELPERTRLAFDMHCIGGRTLRETAMALNLSVTRVHQMVNEALAHCADRLDEAGGA